MSGSVFLVLLAACNVLLLFYMFYNLFHHTGTYIRRMISDSFLVTRRAICPGAMCIQLVAAITEQPDYHALA